MTTWIQNRISNIIAILSYPICIIPSKKNQKEILFADIVSKDKIAIVRRSLKGSRDTFDKFDTVRQDALISELKDVPGLSMNLLGGFFKIKHICYIPTKHAGKEWDGQEDRLWRKYIRFVKFNYPSTPIFFFLEDIHNKPVPYIVSKEKVKEDKFRKLIEAFDIKPVTSNGETTVLGASIIKHCPSRLNYWHVEFRIYDIESLHTNAESTITRNRGGSKYVKTASEFALEDILLNSAYSSISYNTKIGNEFYIKAP